MKIERSGFSNLPNHLNMLVGSSAPLELLKFALNGTQSALVININTPVTPLAHFGVKYVDVTDANSQLVTLRDFLADTDLTEVLGTEVKTIVINSLDALAANLMDQRLAAKKRQVPSYDEWHWLAERMRLICEAYAELPYNTLFLCGTKVTGDSGAERIALDMPTGCISKVLKCVDVAAHLTALGYYDEPTVDIEDIFVAGSEVKIDVGAIVDGEWINTVDIALHPTPRLDWVKDTLGLDIDRDSTRFDEFLFWFDTLPVLTDPEAAGGVIADIDAIMAEKLIMEEKLKKLKEEEKEAESLTATEASTVESEDGVVVDYKVEETASEPEAKATEPEVKEAPKQGELPGSSTDEQIAAFMQRAKNRKTTNKGN